MFLSDDDEEETDKTLERSTDGISCCDSSCGNIMTFTLRSVFIAAGCFRRFPVLRDMQTRRQCWYIIFSTSVVITASTVDIHTEGFFYLLPVIRFVMQI